MARVKVIELRNDLKRIMDDIGKALEGVYEGGQSVQVNGKGEERQESVEEEELTAFGRVDSVAEGGPAMEGVSKTAVGDVSERS